LKRNLENSKIFALGMAIIVLSFSPFSFAQSKYTDNLKLSLNYHRGFSLPEYSFINYITTDPINSLSFQISKETTGKNEWEQLFKYPEYGLSFFYSNLGNDNLIGKSFALNYFFRVNFINKKRFKVYNQTGMGIGYLTKKFDLIENYQNVGIGSHWNAHFNFRLGTSFKLSPKFDSQLGISFDHYSNANSADPNLGLNLITAFAGVTYHVGQQTEKQQTVLEKHVPKNNFEIVQSIGGKQTRALSGKFFMTSSLSGGINRAFFRGFNLGIGADIFYDQAMRTLIEAKEETFKSSDNFQTGIHLSQEFRYNRFSLILQEGIYLGLVNKGIRKTMYNRGIVQFQMTKHFLVRAAMKSHLHILDFPEIGIGYKW
jgi:hypothetical protein